MSKQPRKKSRRGEPVSAESSGADAASPGVPQIRGRIAIEIGDRPALGEAGADLLEQISISGSLSEAARQLHYSYRWAWLLVDGMNHAWEQPLVTTATGGKRGGGAQLTDFGRNVLSAYRQLQLQLEHFLDQQHEPFARAVKAAS
jgi:molybdate transport system regulatory protein